MVTLYALAALVSLWVVLVIVGIWAKSWTLANRVAMATDMLAATVILGRYDVTISTWSAVEAQRGNRVASILIAVLEKLDRQHGDWAVTHDRERAGLVATYTAAYHFAGDVPAP